MFYKLPKILEKTLFEQTFNVGEKQTDGNYGKNKKS